jgi:predicted permease
MAADPDVLGRLLRVNGVPHRVVGVLAPGFRFESRVERAYSALPEAGPGSPAPDEYIQTFARLREGSTPEQLAAELGALLAADAGAAPASRVTFEPLRDRLYGWAADRFSPYMGVVAFVLLLVAANLATLVLVRSIRRRRELAVRAALGADRWRLARLLVAEVALVVAAATALGALLASWGIAAMVRLDLMGVAGTAPRLDARAIGFAMLVGLGAGVLAAVVPVAGLARADLSDALRQSSGRTTGTRRQRTAQRALVVVQIACSLLLLVGAGLLTKTMVRMHRYDPGFETRNLLSMYTSVPEGRYTSEAERRLVIDQTIERIDAVPGVEVAAAVVGGGSFTRGSATRDAGITLEGESAALTPADYGERGSWSYVTAGYFRALGVTMRAGRPFTAADASPSAPPAAIVNEEAARRWWPDSPTVVGRRLKFGGPDSAAPWLTVAGVAPTYGTAVAETMAWEPSPRVFLPLGHDPVPDWPSYYVRTTSSPMALLPAVRAAIDRVDPDILIRNPYDMEGQLAYEVSRYQVSVNVLMACAAFGALLAAMGLYGVVAHGVAARTREIGIRKALGATRRDVLRAVAGEGLVVTVVGLLAGLALSMALSRSLEAMLFGVDPLDPWVFASAAAGFTVIVAVATWLPARRATRVEPTIALRVE